MRFGEIASVLVTLRIDTARQHQARFSRRSASGISASGLGFLIGHELPGDGVLSGSGASHKGGWAVTGQDRARRTSSSDRAETARTRDSEALLRRCPPGIPSRAGWRRPARGLGLRTGRRFPDGCRPGGLPPDRPTGRGVDAAAFNVTVGARWAVAEARPGGGAQGLIVSPQVGRRGGFVALASSIGGP